jgi:HKD family nuclease
MSRLPSGWIPEKPLEEVITNMQTDVLSARCAADRLRLKAAIEIIAGATSDEILEKLITDLRSLQSFAVVIAKAKANSGAPQS